jgi:hypothetical protein
MLLHLLLLRAEQHLQRIIQLPTVSLPEEALKQALAILQVHSRTADLRHLEAAGTLQARLQSLPVRQDLLPEDPHQEATRLAVHHQADLRQAAHRAVQYRAAEDKYNRHLIIIKYSFC